MSVPVACAGSPGYFEPIIDGRIAGWVPTTGRRAAAVRVLVNEAAVATLEPRSARWPWSRTRDAAARFETTLRLSPGDRVRVVDATTGEELAGGVRAVASSRPLRVAIASPVREEAPYLLEWLAYHRALGVQSFLLGDNGGDDDTTPLLLALDEAGIAQRTDWLNAQAFQFDFDLDAARRLRGLVDVVSITDIDEFLRPLNGRSDIPSAVSEIFATLDVSAAAVSLVNYGSAGRVEPDAGFVIERFTQRAPDDHALHRIIKSIVRPERLVGLHNPHQVMVSCGSYVDDRGAELRWDTAPAMTIAASWNALRADHFMVKSYREYLAKSARGRVDLPPGKGIPRDDEFFRSRDRNEVHDPMPAEFVSRMKEELRALRDRLFRFSPRWSELATRL
jgi:hypothetical protein